MGLLVSSGAIFSLSCPKSCLLSTPAAAHLISQRDGAGPYCCWPFLGLANLGRTRRNEHWSRELLLSIASMQLHHRRQIFPLNQPCFCSPEVSHLPQPPQWVTDGLTLMIFKVSSKQNGPAVRLYFIPKSMSTGHGVSTPQLPDWLV